MEGHLLPPETPSSASQAVGVSPSPESDKVKRKRQPRNSACQPCASLKMKCVASTEPGKCERCLRMGRECAPSVPKPRKRRTESGAATDSLGSTIPNLPSGAASTPGFASLETPVSGPGRVSNFGPSIPIGSLLSRNDIRHTRSESFEAVLSQGLNYELLPAASTNLLKGIDYNYVHNSFTVFRQYAVHFPFVNVLHGADPVHMAAHRPVMTAAICTITSAVNPDMRDRCVEIFRLALCTKSIMSGERSIDLLIGLLVHLAWHHHYMSDDQVYQHTCLLAGVATDLGLYGPVHKNRGEDVNLVLERDRAFLGCYYLCCGLSASGFNKPNPLRWTDNLRRCADNVARTSDIPADRMLVSTIETMHAVEDLEDAIRTGAQMERSTFPFYVEMQARAAHQRLKALKREHPYLGSNLGFSAAVIHIYNRWLCVSGNTDSSTLIQCACNIKEYLDDVLARTPTTLHLMAFVDWSHLLEILALMASVSKLPTNTAGWEAGALTSMLQPESVLDSICAHMAAASIGDPLAPRHDALLQWLRNTCDNVKRRMTFDQGSTSSTSFRHPESRYDIVRSMTGGAPAAKSLEGERGHFRSTNESQLNATELPMRYEGDTGLNSLGALGVLEQGFWDDFTSVP